MCYSAIPGQSGRIRAIRDVTIVRPVPPSKTLANVSPPAPLRKLSQPETVCIASGLREPISHDRIPQSGSRRHDRTDKERGERIAKRRHKPCWRNYEKY